ncbi:hypothetical protein J6590_029620, partial [Homalodisca vitripennis]
MVLIADLTKIAAERDDGDSRHVIPNRLPRPENIDSAICLRPNHAVVTGVVRTKSFFKASIGEAAFFQYPSRFDSMVIIG